MKISIIFKQSFKAIFANKARSFLTVLGIIIGIGSVIALISLGNGVQSSISDEINKLGATNITITSGGSNLEGQTTRPSLSEAASTLTEKDLNDLENADKNLVLRTTGNISGSTIVSINGKSTRKAVDGVSANYFLIQNKKTDFGKTFSKIDQESKNKVVVLGNQISKDLFGDIDPSKKILQIGQEEYTVIGRLAKENESSFSDPNSLIVIPYTSAQVTFSTNSFSSFTVQVVSEEKVEEAKSEIEKILLENHNVTNKDLADFTVNTPKDLLSSVSQITGLLTSLLAGIAAISLVVGGIGIMNIMLVSVTERTREIGLRKAIGASFSAILAQFMIEAVLLTIAGGILGILLGIGLGSALGPVLGFSAVLSINSIILAVGVSSVVGLVFGMYPAIKAALLNPIDALRYE